MTLICRYKEFKCFHFSQKWKGDLENSWSFRFIYHGLLTGRCQWILICHALKENWSPVFLVSKNSNILSSIREEEQVSIEFSESAFFLIACLVMKKAIPANLGIVIKLRTCLSALIASCMSLRCFAFSLPGARIFLIGRREFFVVRATRLETALYRKCLWVPRDVPTFIPPK